MNVALEARHLTKRFGDVVANSGVNMRVERGTVHGLVGENGAGKSTLMNMVFGLYQPDDGEILLDGKTVHFSGPQEAIDMGLGMVHQHFKLVEPFTVLENVILGIEDAPLLGDAVSKARTKLEALEKSYGLEVNMDTPVEDLSVGERQRVEILKALYREAQILILDEPTGVLTPQETESLFEIISKLRDEGKTILLITHKLGEIMAITNNVSVMRGGKVVAERVTSETSADELAELMVGRAVTKEVGKTVVKASEAILVVDGLCANDDTMHKALKGVSFAVRSGEILGIAGVSGNGQSELVEVITGMRAATAGEVFFDGVLTASSDDFLKADALRAMGLGHVAEDRLKFGMVSDMSAAENSILGHQKDARYHKHGLLNPRLITEHCDDLMQKYDVRPPLSQLPVGGFSGGNQQKLAIGREVENNPKLLIVGQPTRGV
ncbi:MAG: ABC transporter ATP-binding protein, partial [Sphingomonadales bacterium]|nr:ABC transporter ATP-binding protein [Sphingomonadales bacterium]